MAKLTEQQARRVCEALDINPDEVRFTPAELAELGGPTVSLGEAVKRATEGPRNFTASPRLGAPAWRIAQRAAEEETK